MVGSQCSGVLDDVVRRRVNRSLAYGLRDEVEVVPLWKGYLVVDDRSGRWVDRGPTVVALEEPENKNIILRGLSKLNKSNSAYLLETLLETTMKAI